MKTLLIGINAKYIHTNLAIRYLKSYSQAKGIKDIHIKEYTINNLESEIVRSIVQQKPELLAFSCYIWNIKMVLQICSDIKKLLPNVFIAFGGPEVSYEYKNLFKNYAFLDAIITGEGEEPLYCLIQALQQHAPLQHVPSLVWRTEKGYQENSKLPPMDLKQIPSPYRNLEGTEEFENRIIYYETSRGCPFHCQYCLSSAEPGVRFFDEITVIHDLRFFLEQKVKQVKFVDRTFNCNKKHAMKIWRFLHENDNGVTNFHFEISAELLDKEILTFLSQVRKGQFQFEIGVQSTNEDTLQTIRRTSPLQKVFENVCILKTANNIHLHLDLIAGLPLENYASFGRSFNDVYALKPEKIQLGFLKLLRGSGLRENSDTLGLCYSDIPPYEILYTPVLSYPELCRLKDIENLVEMYYNSSRFQNSLEWAISYFPSPFAFFEALAEYFSLHGYFERKHDKFAPYEFLYDFCLIQQTVHARKDISRLPQLLKHDMLLRENVRNFPLWLQQEQPPYNKEQVVSFYDGLDGQNQIEYGESKRQFAKQSQIAFYTFNPLTGDAAPSIFLYDYRFRDFNSNASLQQIFLFK